MKKIFLFLLVLFLLVDNTQAQKRAENWHFGQNASLSFNNDTLIALQNSGLNTSEGSASISNDSGQLLFYTDGVTVYNSSNSPMPNGTGLSGSSSSTQSALILPIPGNSDLYGILTTDADGGPGGLSYSIVDMTLDNGNGDISLKNQVLMDTASEQVAATVASDGYWVVAHNFPGNSFYAFKVTASGITLPPVISQVGTTIDNTNPINTTGQLKFSPDGSKLAYGLGRQNIYELFDFDLATGIVSNPVTFGASENAYGLEFSASGLMLYTAHYNSFFDSYDVDQYDLSSGDSATIIGSKVTLTNNFSAQLRQMQLGPDSNIYIAKAFQSSLAVINEPDLAGSAADYQDFGVDLDPDFFGYTNSLGLPNFLKSYYVASRVPVNFNSFDTAICAGSCINIPNLAIDPIDSWLWQFTGASPDTSTEANPQNICYNVAGTYSVTLIVTANGGSDTLTLEDAIQVNALPTAAILVTTDTAVAFGGTTYQWYEGDTIITGATNDTLVWNCNPGNYYALVTNENGCSVYTDTVFLFCTGITAVTETGLSVFPNPAAGTWQLIANSELMGADVELFDANGKLVWSSEIREQRLVIGTSHMAQGIYLLRISTAHNSISRKLVRM